MKRRDKYKPTPKTYPYTTNEGTCYGSFWIRTYKPDGPPVGNPDIPASHYVFTPYRRLPTLYSLHANITTEKPSEPIGHKGYATMRLDDLRELCELNGWECPL